VQKVIKRFLLIFVIVFLFGISVFADGAYVDNNYGYNYSVTYKSTSNVIVIMQSKNPIFVDSLLKKLLLNGDVRYYVVAGTTPTFVTKTVVNDTDSNYMEILESSVDLYDYKTRQLIFQSEQTDNVVISNEVIQEFREFNQNQIIEQQKINSALDVMIASDEEFKDKLNTVIMYFTYILSLMIVSFVTNFAFKGWKL